MREPPPLADVTDRIVTSYDDRAVVLGVFDEFDELPPDGRSGPRLWKRVLLESEK